MTERANMWMYLQAFYQSVSEADSERLQNDLGDQLLRSAEEIQQLHGNTNWKKTNPS